MPGVGALSSLAGPASGAWLLWVPSAKEAARDRPVPATCRHLQWDCSYPADQGGNVLWKEIWYVRTYYIHSFTHVCTYIHTYIHPYVGLPSTVCRADIGNRARYCSSEKEDRLLRDIGSSKRNRTPERLASQQRNATQRLSTFTTWSNVPGLYIQEQQHVTYEQNNGP
jgi:hypothetical protein